MAAKQVSNPSLSSSKSNIDTIELAAMPSSKADQQEDQAKEGGDALPSAGRNDVPVEQPDAMIIPVEEDVAADNATEQEGQGTSSDGSNKSETGKFLMTSAMKKIGSEKVVS